MANPKHYINVFTDELYTITSSAHTDREAAIEDAEAWEGRYEYTLTDDCQKLDLRDEFSEEYQEAADRSAHIDQKIDEAKEGKRA
jgi:hypothetical protein